MQYSEREATVLIQQNAGLVDSKLHSVVEVTNLDPLYTEDEEEYDTAEGDEDEHKDEERNSVEEGGVSWLRACIWTISSSTAIYTSKRVMSNHSYHYPLTITFRSFAVASAAYLVGLHLGTDSSKNGGRFSRGSTQRPRREDLWPTSRWLPMIPAAVVASSILPMFLEGILHMPSLPVLVMLFPLAYVVESLLVFITCSLLRSGRWLPWETIVAVIALFVILLDEYRLTVLGLIWGTCAVIAIGVARGFFTIGSEITTSEARIEAYHGFASMALGLGMISSGLLAYCKEGTPDFNEAPLSGSTLVLTLINTASIVSTMFSGTSIIAYSPVPFKNASLGVSSMPLPISDLLASTTSSILVLIAAVCSAPIGFISWLQVAAYILAITCLVGSKFLHGAIVNLSGSFQKRINASGILGPDTRSRETRKPSRSFTSAIFFLLAGFATYFIYDIASYPVSELSPSEASLDLSYVPPTRFDVVIAMYDESPTSVASLIMEILSTTYLSTLKRSTVNTIIYTKSSDVDLDSLKAQTGADTVLRLSNVGREGGTYLHHIVNSWESLAEQTMFIQAGAHNRRELMPRINDYLGAETGMLSLGEAGIVCDCTSCGDRWGWHDSWSVIPSLYSRIHNNACEPGTQILLSYKGQFVASARRIRGIKWEIYRSLMETIESREGWSHDKNVISNGFDSPDNPFFGFTVERAWNLLMQCADENVAAKCPTLLSGTLGLRRGGGVDDCGCADPVPDGSSDAQ